MKYYVGGRPMYESTGHAKESLAQRVLNDRAGKIARGEPVLPRLDRVTYAEAAKDLREHYTSSGDRDIKEAATSWRTSTDSSSTTACPRLGPRNDALHRHLSGGTSTSRPAHSAWIPAWRLVSRIGIDHAHRYPDVAAAIAQLPASTVVLDGELAVFDAQLRSRCEWLRHRQSEEVATPCSSRSICSTSRAAT